MTVDLRKIVGCNLGTIVSGDVGSNHISDRSGLMMWSGRLQLDGIVNPARGTRVELLVASPQRGVVTRFPIPLRVIRAVVFPQERRSEIEVGCKLTLMKERKDQTQFFADAHIPSWYSAVKDAGFKEEAINKVAPPPIYAYQVVLECLNAIGLSLATSSAALSFTQLRGNLDLSQGYVQVLGDLLRSECCFGRILPNETFEIVRIDLSKGRKGPILREYNLVNIDPITTGTEPAEYYITRYNAVQAKQIPADPTGNSGGGGGGNNNNNNNNGNTEDPNDPAAPGSDWTESETISKPNKIQIDYTVLNNGARVAKSVTLMSTTRATSVSIYKKITYEDANGKTQTRDVQLRKIDKTFTTIASINQNYIAWRLSNGLRLPVGGAESTNITYYKYYVGTDGPILFEETSEQYVSEAQFAGGLQLRTYAAYQPSGTVQVLSQRTIRRTLAFKTAEGRDFTQVKTSRWIARGESSEGKQAISDFMDKAKVLIDANPGSIVGIVNGAKELIFEGTEVQNETGRLSLPSKPTDQDIAKGRILNEKSTPTTITDLAQQSSSNFDKTKTEYEYSTTTEHTSIGRAVFDSQALSSQDFTKTAVYDMPYAPDDTLIIDIVSNNNNNKPTVIIRKTPGFADIAAQRFGAMENALDIGHAYGCNIVTGFDELPSLPMSPIYIRQAGIEGAFLMDSTSYAFDGQGMVASADLMLLGVTGYYGAAPPAASWIRIPVPAAGLRQLDDGTIEANYAKANTIAIPSGFNPSNAASTFSALPATGTDVFPTWRDQPHIVGPTLELITLETELMPGDELIEYDYELFLDTETLETNLSVSDEFTATQIFMSVDLPTAVVEAVALAPTIELANVVNLPTAVVETVALAPVVEVPVDITLPTAVVEAVALVPVVEIGNQNPILLLRMNGANGDTSFVDQSSNNFTITRISNSAGQPVISTAQSKYGGASAYFSQATGPAYLQTPESSLFDPAGKEFTIDCWVYNSAVNTYRSIFTYRTGYAYCPFTVMLDNQSTSIRILVANSSLNSWAEVWSSAANIISGNDWSHIRLVGNTNTLVLAVNGIAIFSSSQPSWTPTPRTLYIGADPDGRMEGYIDDFAFYPVALPSNNFTPPGPI